MVSIEKQPGFITWCRLCRVVLTEPEKVLQQAEVALRLASPIVRPRILAIVATASRRTARLDGADKLYTKALHEAKRVGDRWAVADIVHRWARVAVDRGEFKIALSRVREAICHYERIGDDPALGRALVSEGHNLYHLQDYATAEEAFKRALQKLPKAEVAYRISALGNLATIASDQGTPRLALKWLRAATKGNPNAPLGFLVDTLQTQGALSFQAGYLAEAEDCFRRCRTFYIEKGRSLDSAFVTVCLCEVLLAKGEGVEVVALAKESTELIGHLHRHRGPASVMVALARDAFAGREITAEKLKSYREKLAKARVGRPKRAGAQPRK